MSDETSGTDTRCERCGGAHTRRQRCPMDPEPVQTTEPLPSIPVAIAVAPVAPLRPIYFAPAPAFVFPHRARPRTPWWRSALSWTGAISGTAGLLISFMVASVYVARLTQAAHAPAETLTVVGFAIAAGVGSMVGLYLSMRVYAKAVFAGLSLTLVTAGFMMLVIAPVIRQMNTPELAEYRGFAALLWFGAVSLAAGGVLGAMCVRWALRPQAVRRLSRWARLLGAGYGVLQGLSGVLLVLTLLSLINASRGPLDDAGIVERAISITAIGMWALVPGILLTFHGISSSMGEGSGEFRLPVAVYPLAAWIAVLLTGWWVTSASDPVALPMPLLHTLAAGVPGITLVALVARGSVLGGRPVRWLTWRQVTLAAAISMTVGVQIAIYVESIGSLGAVLLLLVHNGAFADATSYAEVRETLRLSRLILTHNEQFAANLVTAAVLAPLAEEFAKGLGVRIMLRRDATRAQAFLLGAAAGAGFGFLEALLYGVAGISSDHLDRWPLIMLIRGGSTSLHVFNTALVGLAWWYWSIGKRARVGWALFATAVFLHALWNGFAVALDSRILGIDTLSERAVEWVAYGVTGLIAVGLVFALPVVARRLRDERSLVEGTELAVMAPWLG